MTSSTEYEEKRVGKREGERERERERRKEKEEGDTERQKVRGKEGRDPRLFSSIPLNAAVTYRS